MMAEIKAQLGEAIASSSLSRIERETLLLRLKVASRLGCIAIARDFYDLAILAPRRRLPGYVRNFQPGAMRPKGY